MSKYNIDFDNVRFKDVKSDDIRHFLAQKGINEKSRKLDTGKLITASLELENYSFSHENISSLLHIGGMSSWVLNGDKKLVHAKYHLNDADLYELAPKDSWLFNLNAQNDRHNTIFYLRRQQRLSAARYCFQLISHYVDGTPKPTHTLSDSDFSSKVDSVEEVIKQYHTEMS